MVERTQSKDYERFKSQLSAVNTLFERAREWADLSNCLQKVKKVIDSNQGLSVPNKKELAKRLAQCLNPDLNVIHPLTLEVYAHIFTREINLMPQNEDSQVWGTDLGLFYSGLFNFYQFAAFEVKRQFLKIIQDYVLKLKRELLISLPGFLLCMLPALEDQNSDLLKQVEAILTETEKIVGTTKFFGEIWKAMLRTPRCRLSATKFLDRRIPRNIQAAIKLSKENKIYLSPYHYQIKSGQVQLDDALSDTTVPWYSLEKRMKDTLETSEKQNEVMDSFFFFYYPNKQKLVNNALLAGLQIVSQEVYVNRAVFDFLISHMPIISGINNTQESENIVEAALITLVKKDFASTKKFFTWFQGHIDDQDSNLQTYKDDPAIKYVCPALKRIFQKFQKVQTDQKVIINELGIQERVLLTIHTPIQIMTYLLSENFTIIQPILSEIAVDLIQYIRNFYQVDQTEQDGKKFRDIVNYLLETISGELMCLWESLGSLLENEIQQISQKDGHKIQAIELITFFLSVLQPTISNEKQKLNDKEENSNLTESLIPIVKGLLSGVEKLTESVQNQEYANPALDLIELILKMMNNFSDKMVRQKNQQTVQMIEILIDQLQGSVTQFNSFYEQLSQRNPSLQFNYQTYKKSSQLLLKVQKYADPNSFSQMPSWLKTVIKCSCERTRGSRLLIVSIEAFISILESHSWDKNISKLQQLILPSQNNNNTYIIEIIQTLWSQLDEPYDHEKIVLLLKRFDKLLPKQFSDVVTTELNDKSRDVKLRAVKKFSIFWKLTAADYNEYKPFQPLSERIKDFNQTTQVQNYSLMLEREDQNQRNYVALHNMLHILEDQDPTMRLSCRSWLSDSKQAYLRILDPLITEFIKNNKVFVSFSGQLFFMEGYDAQIIIENFGKLRNIILNTQDDLIKYIVITKVSNFVNTIFNQNYKISNFQKKQIKLEHSDGKYIQTIVYITLQFIMSQAVESLNQQLYQASQTVNASAAEFMELILKSVQPYKELAQEICHLIISPLINTLRQSIDSGNFAQQVHLLNLIKVILFECNFYSAAAVKRGDAQAQQTAQNAREIFTEQTFVDCIRDGMKNELSFVRNAFIQFQIKLVPFMREIIDADVMTIHCESLLDVFCELLLLTDVSQFQTNSNFAVVASVDLQRKINKERKFTINQENDIIMILNGLKALVHDCLGIFDDFEKVEDTMIEDQLKDLGKSTQAEVNSFSFFGFFRKEVIPGPSDPNKKIKEIVFLKFQKILASCVYIWNDLDLYRVRNYFFTRMGVFAYNKDDDKKMDHQIIQKTRIQNEDNQLFANLTGQQNQRKAEVIIDTISQDSAQRQQSVKGKRKGGPVILSQQQPQINNQIIVDQDTFIKQNLNLIQTNIVSLLEPINKKYSYYLIRGFIEVWRQSSQLLDLKIDLNQGYEKIIQILLSLDIEPHEVIEGINVWIVTKDYIPIKEKRTIDLIAKQKSNATLQSLIFQFIYSYLLHSMHNNFKMMSRKNQINQTQEKRFQHSQEQYTKLYQSMNKFLKYFVNAKHPNTVTWSMEILYLLTNRFKPDDSKLEKKLKLELSEVFDSVLKSAASILTDSFGVNYTEEYGIDKICFSPSVYEMIKRYQFTKQRGELSADRRPYRSNIYLVFDERFVKEHEEIPLQKESIFAEIEQLRDFEKQDNATEMSMFLKFLNNSLHQEECKIGPSMQQEFYKLFTVITLRQTLVRLTLSIFSTEETDKINLSLQIIVASVIKILEAHVKTISTVKEGDLKRQNQVQAEFMSDFLAGLATENTQILQKVYKAEITAIFNSDNFFLMSEDTLRKWQRIMRNFMSDDVFEELLLKFNKVEGIFVSKKWEIQQKSLTFKRLAFLVYSSQTSSFQEAQLDTLLKKMTEGFKNTSKDREFTIQLFLLSRILMLRLSTSALADALRKLWPHLLNELVNVFDVQNAADRDYLLQIEGMKIVELMSQLNIEDFHMNQWMFLFDGYGMEIQAIENNKMIESDVTNQERVTGVFQPYLVKFMCNKSEVAQPKLKVVEEDFSKKIYSFYKILTADEMSEYSKKPLAQGPNLAERRKTAFTGQILNPDDKFSLERETFRYAQELQHLLAQANVEITEIDRVGAEALIEKDFLTKPRNQD